MGDREIIDNPPALPAPKKEIPPPAQPAPKKEVPPNALQVQKQEIPPAAWPAQKQQVLQEQPKQTGIHGAARRKDPVIDSEPKKKEETQAKGKWCPVF